MLINFDLLVVFAFPLKSKELRQRNKLFWYLNIQPSLMYATAVFCGVVPILLQFLEIRCYLWLMGSHWSLLLLESTRQKKNIKRDNELFRLLKRKYEAF